MIAKKKPTAPKAAGMPGKAQTAAGEARRLARYNAVAESAWNAAAWAIRDGVRDLLEQIDDAVERYGDDPVYDTLETLGLRPAAGDRCSMDSDAAEAVEEFRGLAWALRTVVRNLDSGLLIARPGARRNREKMLSDTDAYLRSLGFDMDAIRGHPSPKKRDRAAKAAMKAVALKAAEKSV